MCVNVFTVEFQGVVGPPGFDDCQAVCHGGDVDLRIIGVTVDVESTMVNDLGVACK